LTTERMKLNKVISNHSCRVGYIFILKKARACTEHTTIPLKYLMARFNFMNYVKEIISYTE
jgi:hypothetical protein